MARLLLLNGPPGIGKSTLARRWAEDHPTTLSCDVDVLRTLVGGWRSDYAGAGELVRPAALALVEAYLAGGHDVVLPQLLVRATEVARVEAAATAAGAAFVEVLLTDTPDAVVRRFHARGGGAGGGAGGGGAGGAGCVDGAHQEVRSMLLQQGGDDVVRECCAALDVLRAERPGTIEVATTAGDVEAAYRSVVAAVLSR